MDTDHMLDARAHARAAAGWIESAELLDEQERGAAADTAAAIASAHAQLSAALSAIETIRRSTD